jgi:hypothetical protein
MDTLKIIIGFVILLAGSQLYWFVAAVACVIMGSYLENQSARFLNYWASFSNSLKYSLLGVVFSITAKPFAVLATGFVLGGYLTYNLPDALGWKTSWFSWPYFVVGGTIATLLMIFTYSFGTILITAFAGSVMVVQASNLSITNKNILLLVFLLLGLAAQYLLMHYYEPTID